MRRRIGELGIVMGLIALLHLAGCGKPAGKTESRGGKTPPRKSMAEEYRAGMAEQRAEAEAEARRAAAEKPPAPKMPEVKLPEQLQKTCLVKVGDAMPEAELSGLEGKRVSLRSLFGEKLTVVLFWNSDNLYSTQALAYLQGDVVKPFAGKGVRVVGIDVKDSPDEARKAVQEAGAKFVNLADPQGAYFAKVATERIPRVYLLDPSGKILWFDIEYSTSTRRDLERAIKFALGEK